MRAGEKDEGSQRHTIVNKAQSRTHLASSLALITALERLLFCQLSHFLVITS